MKYFYVTLLTVAAIAVLPRATIAVEAPDPATASRLQSAADAAWRLRLTTTQGSTRTLASPRIDVTGVTASGSRSPRLVRWEEIQRLETQRPARGRGFAFGALIGLGVGLVATLAVADQFSGADPSAALIVLIPVGVGSSALIGGAIGAVTASTSQPLYP